MKSLFKGALLAATVMLAVGCQKEEAPKTETTPAAQTAAASICSERISTKKRNLARRPNRISENG